MFRLMFPVSSHGSRTTIRTPIINEQPPAAGGHRSKLLALTCWVTICHISALELPNHTYIVAQIPPESAERLKSGEHIVLPIGRKVGMTDTARKHLSAICEGYGADMDGVFYAFDNQWQEEHHLICLLLRFGAAALLWLVLSVGLMLVANGFLQRNAKSGKQNRDC